MFVKTILSCSVLAVLTVLSHSATKQQFKPLPRPAVRRDQKTFQQIQNILRKNYERTLREEHEHFRRRNSRFLRADPLISRYRKPRRTVVRRQRKIQAGPTTRKVTATSHLVPYQTNDGLFDNFVMSSHRLCETESNAVIGRHM